MQNITTYDFIIAGTGCAGLSLAMQLKDSKIKFTKVLLIDKDAKTKNDRTWCFWTKKENNWFDGLAIKKWEQFTFESAGFKKEFKLHPYKYFMIRGVDFYTQCLKELKRDSRFEFITEEITDIHSLENTAILKTQTNTYTGNYIFNSAFRTLRKKENNIDYVQHFMGWVIETAEDTFEESCPVFMNFNTEQHNDCRFFYVLPYSKNKALVEYTGFSKQRLKNESYSAALKNYIANDLNIKTYKIVEEEQGEIPMTENAFVNPFGNKVINIGTAAGASKPSTGYTFYFIQKNTQNIIAQLEKGSGSISPFKRKKRFTLYDKILLDVIDKKEMPASEVFTLLFKRNPITSILAFLNEESSALEELGILNAAPKKQFIPSALKKII